MNTTGYSSTDEQVKIGNPSKRRYGGLDVDYDKACEDGLIKPRVKTLAEQIEYQTNRLARWQRNVPKTKNKRANKIWNINRASIALENLSKKLK